MPIATGHEREEIEAELQVSFLFYEGLFCVKYTMLGLYE